jgi:hypothetical protein
MFAHGSQAHKDGAQGAQTLLGLLDAGPFAVAGPVLETVTV